MEIFLNLYKRYWDLGFKSRLYDWLSPEAYLDSLQCTANSIKLEAGEWILDAGCGSGLLVPYIADRLQKGRRYLGMDILPAALHSLKLRSNRLNLDNSVFGVRSDLFNNLPLDDSSLSCVVAHFSIYTLPKEKDRRQVYQEFWRILKTGGTLIVSNPTCFYDAEQIIQSSLMQLHSKGKHWFLKKYVIYPLTLHLGLKYIEGQLKSGEWHGYQPDELREEVAQAGFSIEHSEAVYGGSGFLVVGKKL